jgi:hypothetical protein
MQVLKRLPTAIQEWVNQDEMGGWFQHSIIGSEILETWKTLDDSIIEFCPKLRGELNSFVAIKDTPA